jgi:flagellin
VVGLKQASVNIGEAISMLQIADGAMAQVNTILTRMKALSIQSGSGQLGVDERAILNTEYQSLLAEADRIASDTDFAGTVLASGSTTVTQGAQFLVADGVVNVTFRGDFSADLAPTMAFDEGTDGFTVSHNGINYTGTISSSATSVLLGGSMTSPTVVTLSNATNSNKIDIALDTTFDSGTDAGPAAMVLLGTSVTSFTYKVGTGVSTSADNITVTVSSIAANALGIDGTDISTQANADEASVQIATAINTMQTARAVVGANQNRLNFAATNLATASENTEAARSQLLDLDVAAEMTNFTSNQILVQAGVSMLVQANELPQNLLQLFR